MLIAKTDTPLDYLPHVHRDKVISVKVTDDFYADLRARAFDTGIPVSTLCFLVLKKYMSDSVDGKYETPELDLV